MLGRVVVVGCGLIGGSIVKRLRERSAASSLAAVDRRAVLDQAGLWLDAGEEPEGPGERRLVAEADIVVLAAPIATIAGALGRTLDAVSAGAAVTDCGSVKRPVVALAAEHPRGDRFVGGHPMAGREIGGFAAASPSLFEGCRWYLTSGASASDARARVVAMIGALGGTAVEVSAEHHDLAMAYVSHAPQVVASALVDAASTAGLLGAVGPGFRDTTRIAGGPQAIWRDILAANRANTVRALDEIIARLAAVRDELGRAADDNTFDETLRLLARARAARDGAGF